MQVNGNYNSINSAYRTHKSNVVQEKQIKKPQVDSFTRSSDEDKRYLDHTNAYNQYMMAVLASTAIKHKEKITPAEELSVEPPKEFPAPVEECGNSNPTHNNETHHYNQDSTPDSKQQDGLLDPDNDD